MSNRIKEVMEEQGRNKSWLAKELGLNRATVYKYCSNTIQPGVNNLKKIADLLGKTMDELMD